MIKVIYYSVKYQKIVAYIFVSIDDALSFIGTHKNDIDFDDHFIKILLEDDDK